MIRIFILSLFALNVLVSCVSYGPYKPATKPDKIEFARDRLDVYPDDVRTNSAFHAGAPVVWAGIIRSTDAREVDGGTTIVADTVFEHHHFDWVQDNHGCGVKLSVSPRGEGLFRTKWILDRTSVDSSFEEAEKYAAPGKLAIVYGTPGKVGSDGIVVLKYRYLRIFDTNHFNTNEYDYGRLGEPFHPIHANVKTNSVPAKNL